MNPHDSVVSIRLKFLDERIGRLERHLGLEPLRASSTPVGVREGVVSAAAGQEEAREQMLAESPGDVPASTLTERRQLRSMLDAIERDGTKRDGADAFSIERLIGQRWFAAIGALIVVVGVGLFFKLAYDLGWLGRMPPMWRCLSGAFFGAGLLGFGEWLRRKVGDASAAGASAAGVGVLYASAYAAYGLFGLVTPAGAVVTLSACVVIGLLVSARAGLAVVACVSLMGGYLTPLLLADSGASPYFLPAYLVALLIVAQGLVAWKSLTQPYFGFVRGIAWAGTLILGTMWLLNEDSPRMAPFGLAFVVVVWALVQGELLLTARRSDSLRASWAGNAEAAGERANAQREDAAFQQDGLWIASSMSLTGWAGAFALFLVSYVLDYPSWLAPAVGCAVTLVLAAIFAGHMRMFVDVPRRSGERLGAGFLLQAAALLAVALAAAFSGWTLVLSWLAIGLTAIIVGRWIGSRPLDVYGVANLSLATMAFIGDATIGWSATSAASDFWGIPMSIMQWRGMLVGAAWLAGAALLLWRHAGVRLLSMLTMLVGVVILMLVPASEHALMLSLMVYWVGLASVLAAAGFAVPRMHLGVPALGVLVIALGAWCFTYAFGWTPSSAAMFAHPGLWSCGLICAAMVLIARFGQPRLHGAAREVTMPGVWIIAGGALFAATSLELARVAAILASESTAARAAVSIYWGLLAIALLWRGFIAKQAPVRYLGLGLMGVAALKVVIVDLDGIAPVWRVVSFIVLGMLMLVVAAGYGWVARRLPRT